MKLRFHRLSLECTRFRLNLLSFVSIHVHSLTRILYFCFNAVMSIRKILAYTLFQGIFAVFHTLFQGIFATFHTLFQGVFTAFYTLFQGVHAAKVQKYLS